MNAEWHEQHVMPKNASLEARIAWHRAHQRHCACRPIPAKLLEAMGATPRAAPRRSGEVGRVKVARTKGVVKSRARVEPAPDASPIDPRFAKIVSAFQREPDVTYGGKGFGSSALKHGGKIFAMLTTRSKFVVKLSKARVSELVKSKQGCYFDPGHGRLMKEWLELPDDGRRWRALAAEALATARGAQASRDR